MTTANLTILNWPKSNSGKEKESRGTDRNQSRCGLWVPAAAAFLLAALCSGFFLRVARVQGASMEPTLYHNEWVLSLPGAYRNSEPQRGDVILIQRNTLTQGYIVKRVIGLPGETIEIHQGKVLINGVCLEESYLMEVSQDTMQPITVGADCFFVLGDNRVFSQDSRYWEEPLVQKEELRGKVICLLFPRVGKMQ